jgi:hypothetical protein
MENKEPLIVLPDSTVGDHLRVYRWKRKGLLRRWEAYPVFNSTYFTWNQTLDYLWDKFGIYEEDWLVTEDSVVAKCGRQYFQILAPQ